MLKDQLIALGRNRERGKNAIKARNRQDQIFPACFCVDQVDTMSEQADIHTAVNMKFDDCNRKQAKVRDLPSMHNLGSGTRRKFSPAT